MTPILGQATTAKEAIETGIGTMITDGTAVGVVAIGLFVAVMAFKTVKRFALAGK